MNGIILNLTFFGVLLQYNTKYYYKIGTGSSAREFWFKTPPEVHPDSAYTFGIIGWYYLSIITVNKENLKMTAWLDFKCHQDFGFCHNLC